MKCHILLSFFALLIGSVSADLKPRIIGGKVADIKDYPYLASLRVYNQHGCGGCIISKKHILTAAHCISDIRRIDPTFEAATIHTGTSSSIEIGNSHGIDKVTTHPRYTGLWETSFIYDIGVITLKDEIVFDETQQKINLASHNVVDGNNAYFAGWGQIEPSLEKTTNSIQLMKLTMTILTYEECQSVISLNLNQNHVCAYHSVGHGSYYGDSGGPLVTDNQVIGILSWADKGLPARGMPEVYINVYTNRAFIESVMNQD